LPLPRGHVQVHQHDDEQEQDHDSADVEDDLHGEQEFGLLEQVKAATPSRLTIRDMAL